MAKNKSNPHGITVGQILYNCKGEEFEVTSIGRNIHNPTGRRYFYVSHNGKIIEYFLKSLEYTGLSYRDGESGFNSDNKKLYTSPEQFQGEALKDSIIANIKEFTAYLINKAPLDKLEAINKIIEDIKHEK